MSLRPTSDGLWIPVVVASAAIITLALLAQLANQAWLQAAIVGGPRANTEIGAVLGGIGAVALLASLWTWRYHDVWPWARAAVALVCVHVAIAAGAWFLSVRLHSPDRELPLQSVLPAPLVALVAAGVLFFAAAIHARVRRLTRPPGWLRGAVAFALAFLFALGMWVPLVARTATDGLLPRWPMDDFQVFDTLCPPAGVALVVAAVTVLRPRWLPALRVPAFVLASMAFVAALLARDGASIPALLVYANYVHVLFAAAFFALAALAALAWTQARLLRANRADIARPAPWVQRGVVEPPADDRHEVGAWCFDGWLAGMRTSLSAFTLRTARGEALVVPPGSRLVAALPEATVTISRDELIPVVEAGDEVIVSGFVAPTGDGPYRTGGLPIPGPDGLVVTVPRRAHEAIGRDVILRLYRPCVLFLVIAALAALPGVIGSEETSPTYGYHYVDH